MQRTIVGERLAPKVLASAADGFVNWIGNNGCKADRIFEKVNISPSHLHDPLSELELREFCKLFDIAAEEMAEDHFGLLFGTSYTPNRLGPVGYLAMNSPTLHAALKNFINFFPAHQDSTCLSLAEDMGIMKLSYEILDPRITHKAQDAELSIACFVNIFKHCLGPGWAPLEIHFSHQNFHHSSKKHEQFFGCTVLFNRPSNSILFRKSALNSKMPGCDPYLFTIVESTLRQRIEQKFQPDDLANQIKHHIKTTLGDSVPSLAKVASLLDLEEALIKRKLCAQGVNFNDILKSARQELAMKYLVNSDMQLTEVALALGYSELSAFSRAFRAWSGMTPQKFRKSNSVI